MWRVPLKSTNTAFREPQFSRFVIVSLTNLKVNTTTVSKYFRNSDSNSRPGPGSFLKQTAVTVTEWANNNVAFYVNKLRLLLILYVVKLFMLICLGREFRLAYARHNGLFTSINYPDFSCSGHLSHRKRRRCNTPAPITSQSGLRSYVAIAG